ncbi:unnamed protein product [Acanthoscelides obtectus]|uniref:Uncharacterized protein n=1 Tax=Acanthoscelides obtectus TaxID=200917 RepID=A0A9P0JII6_ACAOB|nr:unnamed protein product [Acanthoscelides obtectus]CAK1661546.1 hypothetical protein AOBTE_LOCUS22679 [Acanthoscelides obtectus]
MLVDYGTVGYYPTKIFKTRYLRSLPRIQENEHKDLFQNICDKVAHAVTVQRAWIKAKSNHVSHILRP